MYEATGYESASSSEGDFLAIVSKNSGSHPFAGGIDIKSVVDVVHSSDK